MEKIWNRMIKEINALCLFAIILCFLFHSLAKVLIIFKITWLIHFVNAENKLANWSHTTISAVKSICENSKSSLNHVFFLNSFIFAGQDKECPVMQLWFLMFMLTLHAKKANVILSAPEWGKPHWIFTGRIWSMSFSSSLTLSRTEKVLGIFLKGHNRQTSQHEALKLFWGWPW